MINYSEIFSEKLHTLKDSGTYRYFLNVNKSAQHFPVFYFEDADGTKRKAISIKHEKKHFQSLVDALSETMFELAATTKIKK